MIKQLVIRNDSIYKKSKYRSQYVHDTLQNTEYVLCSSSAAEYLGLCNALIGDNEITVVTKQDCLMHHIDFDNIHGTLCTTVNQTINDLLADKMMDEQVIMESLAECYYKDNYASLNIQPSNKKTFDHFRPMAEEYYISD